MPRKSRLVASATRREHRVRAGLPAEDRGSRVPIIGLRVAAGLRLAGISNAQAARLLRVNGVEVTAQAINDIVNSRTKSTRPKIRSGLAKLAGRPFSAKFLGGEKEIEVPPMPIVLSKRDHWWAWGFADPQNLVGSTSGLAYRPPRKDDGTPALYELYALVLYSRIEQAWKRDFSGTAVSPRLYPLLRKLLALSHWRGLVTITDEASSKIDRSFWDDAGQFAEAMLTACSFVLQPWLEGHVKPRRYMVSALHHFLEASITLDEALHNREAVPNAQSIRREVSAKWFGDRRLLSMKELLNMAAFGTYQRSLVTTPASDPSPCQHSHRGTRSRRRKRGRGGGAKPANTLHS